MADGTLVAESLRVGARIEGIALTVTEVTRADAGDVARGQPAIWTLVAFTFDEDDLDRLVEALEANLEPELGWYCDLHTTGDTVVVFAGRSFRYPRGSAAGRAAAAEHARARGVPEEQLDWPE